MIGQSGHAPRKDGIRSTYYRCHKTWPDYGSDRCCAKSANGEAIDSVAWEYAAEFLRDEQRLFEGIAQKRVEADRARQTIQVMIAALGSQDQKARTKIERLLDLYAGGELDKPTYLAKRAEFEKEIEKRKDERKELDAQLAEFSALTLEQEAEIRQYRLDVLAGLAGATFEDKVRALRMLHVECIYDDRTDEVIITGLLGRAQTGIKFFKFLPKAKVPVAESAPATEPTAPAEEQHPA